MPLEVERRIAPPSTSLLEDHWAASSLDQGRKGVLLLEDAAIDAFLSSC